MKFQTFFMQPRLLVCILIFYSVEFNDQVLGKFLIKSFKSCDSHANYPIELNITFRTVGELQHVEGCSTFRIPGDNTLRLNITVEMLVGNDYKYLFTIHENKACDAMHKVFGEFIYEIERNVGLIPRLCPIPQGTYRLHNVAVHYEKMAILETVPFGKMRTTTVVVDPKNRIATCLITEVDKHL